LAHEKPFPKRGEIRRVDFSPSIGSEIQDRHPALVVSVDELNRSPWGLIVVCPVTTFRKDTPFRLHILISPPEGGIHQTSVIRCDQVKSLSIQRFLERWGTVNADTLKNVDFILKKVLGL